MPRTAESPAKTKDTDIIRPALAGRNRRIAHRDGVGILRTTCSKRCPRHGGFDLEVEARGDLQTGDHHTVEDCRAVSRRGLPEGSRRQAGIVRRLGVLPHGRGAGARRRGPLRPAAAECGFETRRSSDIGNFRLVIRAVEFLRALRCRDLHPLTWTSSAAETYTPPWKRLFKSRRACAPAGRLGPSGESSVPSTKGTL